MLTSSGDQESPRTVAIVAMGPSRNDYLAECAQMSGRHRVADETWAINAMSGVIQHDRAIIMDALPYFAQAARESAPMDGYRDWLRIHPGPIYTQRRYEGFPGSVEYPLEAVLNTVGYPYFNNTCAYALCLAIHLRVRHIKLYGMDFTYPGNKGGFAEAGRACVEFWIREACHRKMQVSIAPSSMLLDQATHRPLYGYSVPPVITQVDGKFRVTHPPALGAIPPITPILPIPPIEAVKDARCRVCHGPVDSLTYNFAAFGLCKPCLLTKQGAENGICGRCGEPLGTDLPPTPTGMQWKYCKRCIVPAYEAPRAAGKATPSEKIAANESFPCKQCGRHFFAYPHDKVLEWETCMFCAGIPPA